MLLCVLCVCVFSREALDHQVFQELLDNQANQETQETQYVQSDEWLIVVDAHF